MTRTEKLAKIASYLDRLDRRPNRKNQFIQLVDDCSKIGVMCARDSNFKWSCAKFGKDVDHFDKKLNDLLKECSEIIMTLDIPLIKCPVCGKELIRLEPYKEGICNFWCDDCKVDIKIEKM